MKPRGRSMAGHRYGLFVALLAGCASQTSMQQSGPSTDPNDVLSRLVNTDNGLEVHRWVVSADTEMIGATLMRFQEGEILSRGQAEALRRCGLRLVRVSEHRLADLLGNLDTAPVEVTAWHGQILQWRQLQQQRIPELVFWRIADDVGDTFGGQDD